MRAVVFEALDMQTANILTTQTDAFSAPPRSISSAELARFDGAVELFRRYGSRNISLSGWLVEDSITSNDELMDQLKLYLNRTGNLDIGFAGGTRRWYGTMQNVVINQDNGEVSKAQWSAQLFCANPFATDTTSAELFNVTTTDGSKIQGLSALGTAYAIPVIEVTITAISPNNSDVTMTFGNPGESRLLSITRTFTAGDTITINPLTGQVFHNTTLVEADGQFPIWVPGSGTFEYGDTAATRNVTIVATYEKRFL